jgi:hypothetical protein
LIHRGPVVSQSFILNEEEYLTPPFSLGETVGGFHELTLYGEVWHCQPQPLSTVAKDTVLLLHNTDLFIPLSMGHWGIHQSCVAPKLDFLDHICWQIGHYFDVDFTDLPDWREWGELEFTLDR